MNKIKYLSSMFKWLFQISFVLLPLFYIYVWLSFPSMPMHENTDGFSFSLSILEHLPTISHPLSIHTKLAGLAISIIPLSLNLFIIYSLIQLFSLYEKNEIFSIKNVSYLKHIGIGLLLTQLISPFYQALITGLLTWGNPAGQRVMTVSLDHTNLEVILIALIAILISWIMSEGHKLKEEQRLTV